MAGIAEAGIDPEPQPRKTPAQIPEHAFIVAGAFDGIEIGDIEDWEGSEPQQPAHHRLGRASLAERRAYRTVIGALAHARMHDLALPEVDDGDDLEHGMLIRHG